MGGPEFNLQAWKPLDEALKVSNPKNDAPDKCKNTKSWGRPIRSGFCGGTSSHSLSQSISLPVSLTASHFLSGGVPAADGDSGGQRAPQSGLLSGCAAAAVEATPCSGRSVHPGSQVSFEFCIPCQKFVHAPMIANRTDQSWAWAWVEATVQLLRFEEKPQFVALGPRRPGYVYYCV